MRKTGADWVPKYPEHTYPRGIHGLQVDSYSTGSPSHKELCVKKTRSLGRGPFCPDTKLVVCLASRHQRSSANSHWSLHSVSYNTCWKFYPLLLTWESCWFHFFSFLFCPSASLSSPLSSFPFHFLSLFPCPPQLHACLGIRQSEFNTGSLTCYSHGLGLLLCLCVTDSLSLKPG